MTTLLKIKGGFLIRRYNLHAGDDFTIEVSLRHINGTETSGYGFLWGDESKGVDYNFLLTGDGSYKLSLYKDSKWSDVIKWTDSGHIRKKGVNHLKVVKKGSSAKLYINGEFIKRITVEDFEKNYVGVTIDREQKVVYYGIKVTKN